MTRKRNVRKTVKRVKRRNIVFSSKESEQLAKAIQRSFDAHKYTITTWSDGFFKLSQSSISDFSRIQYDYDYAIVICGPDDVRRTRRKERVAPRDNVLLELGLCIGSFGLERVIIVKEETVTLPSDLDGITYVSYEQYEPQDLSGVAGRITAEIDNHISNAVSGEKEYITLPWDEYFHCIKRVTQKLDNSISLGGFQYDAIVGINRGGLMTADMIVREKATDVPVVPIYADRRKQTTRFDVDDGKIKNSDIMNLLDNDSIHNILLVDSFTRDGITVVEAKKYLTKRFPNKVIKSVVIYANKCFETAKPPIADFVGEYKSLDGKKLSLD